MSNYNNLKTTIDANIKQNGNQEITGPILNSVLNQMVNILGTGYQFAGVATLDPATNPGTPDAKVFYIANGKGTYTNFGSLEVTEDDVVILYWDTAWHKVATGIASQAKLSELESKGFVQYNESQSLTESQKQQARLNIDAPEITDITLEGLENFIIKNDDESALSNYILRFRSFLKKLDQYCAIKVLMYDKTKNHSVIFSNNLTSSNSAISISDSNGKVYCVFTPTTQAPYSTSTLPDVFTEYNIEIPFCKITAQINWHQLYSVPSYNYGTDFGILLRNVTYVSQSAIYPFVGGKGLNLRALSYIKDIYIPNRNPQLHYFIWYSYPSTTNYYQICLASSPVDNPESSDDVTELVTFVMLRSDVTSEMRKGYYLWEKNGYKILIDFNEADNTPTTLGYWKPDGLIYSSLADFDWHNIDKNSPILLADIIAAKQDKLISGTNIKTINNQSILGNGDIQIAESIVNSPDNVTLEESNSILRLKELNNSSYKYGFKHVYDDITIDTDSSISSWANSIVEIKGTITVTGSKSIWIPNNCILYFNGGSMRGVDFTGKLYPNSAKIIASPYQIFFGDLNIYEAYGNDKFFADIAYGEWFGAKGDGVSPDGWAFNKLTSSIHCNKIQLLKKTYILERNISISSCTLSGYGAKLQRYAKFADVLITTPIETSSSGIHILSVDTNSPTYANLEIGMAVFIIDKVSNDSSRRVAAGRWIVSDINGSSVTIVGNSMNVAYPANTMCLVTGYNLVNLSGKNAKVEGIFLDGLFNITNPIYPLDRTPWEVDYTIGGYGVENAIIENCYITNSLADAIMVGGKNNIFSHNTILHSGGNGIHLSGNYVVHIDNNYIFDSNLNPLTFHNEGAITYSNNIFEVTITNNVFDNCLAGIGSIDSADDCKSIIIGNIFRNFRTHGIQGYATNTSFGNITKQFIISNNRFIGTQDDSASWETRYLYTPLIPRQEATGFGIYLPASSSAFWNSIMINNNDFEDCGLYVGNALLLMFNNNIINIEHTFTSSTPTDIIQIFNTTGSAQDNVILSDSPSKTNCFVLNGSKVAVNRNSYKLTNCTLSDTSYALMADNVDIS